MQEPVKQEDNLLLVGQEQNFCCGLGCWDRGGWAALPNMLVGDVGKLEKGKNSKDGPDSLFCLLFSLETCPLNLDSH